jgi:hypothetical protein
MYTYNILQIIIPVVIAAAIIYLPFVIKLKTKNNIFLSKEWILNAVWFGLLIFVLEMDGEFVSSGISHHILWATIIMSVINCIPVIFVKIKELNVKVKGGEIEVNANANANIT